MNSIFAREKGQQPGTLNGRQLLGLVAAALVAATVYAVFVDKTHTPTPTIVTTGSNSQ